MEIALIGYGAMGKMIHRLAEEKGHGILTIIAGDERGLAAREMRERLLGADVAIDFTHSDAVRRNVEACMTAGVPLIEGTTGWIDELNDIEKIVVDANGAFVFGANFSIGVNLFYRVADFAAQLFSKFPAYEVFIEEQHHSRKKDAPSGTALKLRDIVEDQLDKSADSGIRVPVASTRAGNIPGTHRVGFDGAADQILLEHAARSREGFASGAILAAEWIVGKTGFYEFTEIIDAAFANTKL